MSYDPKKISGTDHRDLEVLHPDVQELANIFIKNANNYLKPLGFNTKPVSTLRTWTEQTKIYNQGRTTPGAVVSNAKAGDSIHNWGCAFDLGIYKDGEYWDAAVKKDANGKNIPDNVKRNKAVQLHIEISKISKSIGLFWGGDFNSIKDYPHYQYTGKYSNSEFLAKAKSGVSVDDLLDPIGALIVKLKNEGKL